MILTRHRVRVREVRQRLNADVDRRDQHRLALLVLVLMHDVVHLVALISSDHAVVSGVRHVIILPPFLRNVHPSPVQPTGRAARLSVVEVVVLDVTVSVVLAAHVIEATLSGALGLVVVGADELAGYAAPGVAAVAALVAVALHAVAGGAHGKVVTHAGVLATVLGASVSDAGNALAVLAAVELVPPGVRDRAHADRSPACADHVTVAPRSDVLGLVVSFRALVRDGDTLNALGVVVSSVPPTAVAGEVLSELEALLDALAVLVLVVVKLGSVLEVLYPPGSVLVGSAHLHS